MLNRHPEIAICRETDYYHYVYRRRRAFGNLSDPRNRERLAKEYLSTQRMQRMRVDLRTLETMLLREGDSYKAFFSTLLGFYAQTHGKRRCGEKTPQHALFTETLCAWYPGGTVIHLVRDPRDVIASLLRLPSAPNNVIGNANLWLRDNRAARQSRNSSQYLLVYYEQLVSHPEEELRRICAFIGEGYSPAMLIPNWDVTADRPWLRRAEEPVTTERLGKWREELTPEEVALVEWVVGPEMRRFGYEPAGRSPSYNAIGRTLLFAAWDAVSRRAGEFPGMWYSATRSRQLAKEEAAKERYRNRTFSLFH